MSTAPEYLIAATSPTLEAIEMGLDLLARHAENDGDHTTLRQVTAARESVTEAARVADDGLPADIDAGRLSLPSDVSAWDSFCANSNSPEGRARNSQRLQAVVDIHYPATTEKGQH